MNITYLNFLPNFGFDNTIYYLNPEGKFYGWDKNNSRFYNLSTPALNDVQGISFDNLQEGDVLSYDSVSQTWINKISSTSTGVNSFNERQGDVYLLGTDVTYALEYTPEDLANKSTNIDTDQASDTKYPSVKSVYNWVTGLGYITSSSLTGYATETWVNNQGFITNIITALGYTPENEANKTSTVAGNETSEAYFPTIKGLVDWVNSLFITINANFNWYIKGEASWNLKDLDTDTTFFKVNTNGNVLIGTDVEEPSSILNINSTVKGFLPPRMPAEARRSILMPAIGLMVYQTDEEEGLYINKSEGWVFIR